MNSDDRFWICVVAIIATAAVIFCTSMNYFYTKRMISYVENGYCENSTIGNSGTLIQKCDK